MNKRSANNTRPRTVLFSFTALVVPMLLLAAPANAEPARKLMDKVFSKSSWKDMQGNVTLTLTNKAGKQKVRKIKMWNKKNPKGESSMLMRFVQPADVKGTGFLTIEHKNGEDDRRLFLPSLRRVNRISTSGSGGNFMSSDFTYYDIGSPKLEDWSYAFAGEKTVNGVPCKVVTGTAVNAKVTDDTGYAKVVWFVDPKRLIVLGAEYYEKGDRKLKTLEVVKVEMVSGIPFGTHMKVADAHSGHHSQMVFSDLTTDNGIPDKVFSERNLRKWTR